MEQQSNSSGADKKGNSKRGLVPFDKKNHITKIDLRDYEDNKTLVKQLLSESDSNNIVEQKNNDVKGDLVGRDKIVTTNNFNITQDKSIYLKTLYDKFLNEEKNNATFKSFIAELDYYNTAIGDEEVIGLDNKLIAGNRANVIWYAKEVKERFHKKLLQTSQFSDIAQKINVYLLATVRSYYMLEIYPRVCKREDENLINSLIKERIINPLIAELGDNLFDFTPDDIQGMLYFLTGNCHIKWTE